MIFAKKELEWTLEVGFFLIFVIFVFYGPILGHVSGQWACARSWKADMFRHKNFENRIKIEGVMALTLKIFQITQCMIHGP